MTGKLFGPIIFVLKNWDIRKKMTTNHTGSVQINLKPLAKLSFFDSLSVTTLTIFVYIISFVTRVWIENRISCVLRIVIFKIWETK